MGIGKTNKRRETISVGGSHIHTLELDIEFLRVIMNDVVRHLHTLYFKF